MKNQHKISAASLLLICFLYSGSLLAQANQSLSNLKNPTAVNRSLSPGISDSINLGTSLIGWRNLYVTRSIFFGGIGAISCSGTNTAFGLSTLNSNSSGYQNTAVGDQSVYFNSTGYNNSAMGYNSLYNNLVGNSNTAAGSLALWSNNVGSDNTGTGAYAAYSNTEGDYNTACGYKSLYTNTDGDRNLSLGVNSLYSNTHGSYNVAVGNSVLYNNTTGNYNTGAGYEVLYNTTNTGNTGLGYLAGNSYNNGAYNVFVGYDADANGGGYTNSSCIGYGSRITASNQVRVGKSTVTSIGGYAGWSNISDARVKTNIKENVLGLDFINRLRPVTYNLDVHAIDSKLGIKEDASDNTAIAEKEKFVYSGFIAQEVEKSAKELNYDFSGVDAPKNEEDLYSLRYADFVVPLVKAVQELSKQNEDLKERVASLEQQVVAKASDLSTQLSSNLGQNIPNPADRSMIIPIQISENCTEAHITIVNTLTGSIIAVIPVSCSDNQVVVNADELVSGTYSYSLFVNGKVIGTRQMTIQK